MSPDHQSNHKGASQHWRPPGCYVQRTHHQVGQTQLISTPDRKTSPKISKGTVAPVRNTCRPIALDAALDSPATPDHRGKMSAVQQELRLTPPSMQSPDIYARHNHGNSSRNKTELPRLREAGENLKSQCPQSAQRCKGGDAGTAPVRVPTTVEEKRHREQRGLASNASPTQDEARLLSNSYVDALPDFACDAPHGVTAVCCLHTRFFAFNHCWK